MDDDAFGKILATLVLLPVSFLLRGLALVSLWRWFVVPLGAAEIGMASAIGLALTATVFVSASASGDGEWIERLVGAVVQPVMILAIGYVIHLFV